MALLDVYWLPMSRTVHREEIEIKLRVRDLDASRARLRRLRARIVTPRVYEFNTLYDTPRHGLWRSGRLIRVRIEQTSPTLGKYTPDKGAKTILTYKGPPFPPARSAKSVGSSHLRRHYKIREEAEVSVSCAEDLSRILAALGLHPVFRYDKFRTTYALPGVRQVKIELDETPIGTFLELEGSVAGIDRAAQLLGYGPSEYLKDSYGALYLAACRRQGRKPGNMLFSPTKK